MDKKRAECIVEFLRTRQKCLEKNQPQASALLTHRMFYIRNKFSIVFLQNDQHIAILQRTKSLLIILRAYVMHVCDAGCVHCGVTMVISV